MAQTSKHNPMFILAPLFCDEGLRDFALESDNRLTTFQTPNGEKIRIVSDAYLTGELLDNLINNPVFREAATKDTFKALVEEHFPFVTDNVKWIKISTGKRLRADGNKTRLPNQIVDERFKELEIELKKHIAQIDKGNIQRLLKTLLSSSVTASATTLLIIGVIGTFVVPPLFEYIEAKIPTKNTEEIQELKQANTELNQQLEALRNERQAQRKIRPLRPEQRSTPQAQK